jgi:hypothetical protein
MKYPPPSTYESRMIIFKLNPSLKILVEEKMPRGDPTLPLPSQIPFDDQPRNEI